MLQRLVLVLAVLSLCAGLPAHSGAQQAEKITVQIVEQGGSGLTGLALLEAVESGTSVQVVVLGAQAGTVAVIHRGTCDQYDPLPEALLGDVGAAGQIQVVVPTPFATLAAGGYVIAVHAGLADLATSLACGEIGAVVAGPTVTAGSPPTSIPEESPAAGVQGNDYTSPTYGYSLSWDDSWTVQQENSQPTGDLLVLVNGVAIFQLQGYEGHNGDARRCIQDNLVGFQGSSAISNFTTMTGPDGQPVEGGDADSAFEAVTLTFTQQDGTALERAVYVECRRLSDVAVVLAIYEVPAEAYETQTAHREALLETLTLPAGGDSSTILSMPTVTTVATTVATTVPPTAAATAVPTQDPACAGVAEWIATVTQFGTELAAIFQPIYEGFQRANQVQAANGLRAAPEAAENLLIRFQQIPVPPLVAEIHEKIVASLQQMVDGLYQWRSGFETANQTDYFTGTQKVTEAEQQLAALQTDLQKIANQCGLQLPTATPVR